jgi:LytS/YehU family sensor histidine kinase
VLFSEELAIVDQYLALEQIRFEARLQVRRTIEPASLQAHLPPMLLQVTVENALKHGVAKETAGGLVTIDARLEDNLLRLRVTNPGLLGEGPLQPGIGLRYAGRAQLELRQTGATVTAELTIAQ